MSMRSILQPNLAKASALSLYLSPECALTFWKTTLILKCLIISKRISQKTRLFSFIFRRNVMFPLNFSNLVITLLLSVQIVISESCGKILTSVRTAKSSILVDEGQAFDAALNSVSIVILSSVNMCQLKPWQVCVLSSMLNLCNEPSVYAVHFFCFFDLSNSAMLFNLFCVSSEAFKKLEMKIERSLYGVTSMLTRSISVGFLSKFSKS